jgi:hypothetical protein
LLAAEVARLPLDGLHQTGAVAQLVEEVAATVTRHALGSAQQPEDNGVQVPTALKEARRIAARRVERDSPTT